MIRVIAARRACQRMQDEAFAEILKYLHADIANDGDAFRSVARCAVRHCGFTTRRLAEKCEFGEDVIIRITSTTGPMPSLDFALNRREPLPEGMPLDGRARVFWAIGELIEEMHDKALGRLAVAAG